MHIDDIFEPNFTRDILQPSGEFFIPKNDLYIDQNEKT